VFTGLLIGFAFLAKMLQAFLVVPGLAAAYMWAGPPRLGKRIWQTVLMGAGIVAGAGWWILAAQLTPAADRPYFGGSTTNNILQLTIGYNGLGRLTGDETGSVGPGGGGGGQGASFGGATGIFRLFHAEFGGQVSWLLPTALISLAVMAWVSRRAARTDRTRAAALLWGGWVLVTGLVFSFMNGIIHPYYMVALAPGIAALTGIGAMALRRAPLGAAKLAGRIAAACGVLASAVWAYILLDRTPDWLPWLRWVVLVAGVAAAGLVLAGPALARLAAVARSRRGRLALAAAPLGLALVAGLAGPAAYALDTVATAHTGAIPSAGPAAAGFVGGQGGGPGGRSGFPGAGLSGRAPAGTGTAGGTGAPNGTGMQNGSSAQNGSGASSGSAAQNGTGAPGGNAAPGGAQPGSGTAGRTGARGSPGDGGFGVGGGLGGDTTVSSALTRLLEQDASSYKWVAATEGSESAAPLELATGDAVMAIGGFNGTDPWPTLAVFKELVAKHEIHYYVGQGSQSFGGGGGSSAIASWVAAHFKKQTVGGQTVYDLTRPLS
jgi:4-amino-4-deoxy-L-arabinose transferase-like glycosyltransferase